MASPVQAGVANGSAAATSIAAAYGSNVTAGSRLVAAGKTAAGVALTSAMMTDTQGNTWVLDRSYTGTTSRMGRWSTIAGSSGANTVTFNPNSSARIGIVVWEFSGLDPYGSVGSDNTGTSTAPDSGNFTPAAATGAAFAQIQSSQSVTWEADYATGAVNNGTGRIYDAYDLAPPASAQSASGTIVSTTWDCSAAWYPDTAAGGGRIWNLAGNGGGLAGPPRGLAA